MREASRVRLAMISVWHPRRLQSTRSAMISASRREIYTFRRAIDLEFRATTWRNTLLQQVARSRSLPARPSSSAASSKDAMKQNNDTLVKLMRWARQERNRRQKLKDKKGPVNGAIASTASPQRKRRPPRMLRRETKSEQKNIDGTENSMTQSSLMLSNHVPDERQEPMAKERKQWNEDMLKTLEMIRTASPRSKSSNDIAETELQTETFTEKLADKQFSDICFAKYSLDAIEVPFEAHIYPPVLEHGIDRVLFNPGVHFMQDPRSRVYNFPPELKHIMSVHEFDYDALPEYQISSKDKVLQSIAKEHKCKYYGSTSSLTAMLSQFHYLISKWRPPNGTHISHHHDETLKFTAAASMAASVFLRYMPETGLYAIDSDKSEDSEIILMWLGRSMELQLVTPLQEYENFRRSKSHMLGPEQRKDREAYHYSKCGDFMLRSQQDCMDPRLPNGGTFDLKTRAVAAVRYDMDHIHEVGETGYQLKTLHGKYESFESEYRDMIRASFLKYSLQARIGRMDGILVAYHNIARLFGFQYVPLEELDLCIHGENHKFLAKQEFAASMGILNDFLDRVTTEYPGQSVNLVFYVSPETNQMSIFLKLMTNEEIDTEQAKKRDQGFRLKPTAERIAKQLEDDPELPNSKVEEIVRTMERSEAEVRSAERNEESVMTDSCRVVSDRNDESDYQQGVSQPTGTDLFSSSLSDDEAWARSMKDFGIEIGRFTDDLASRELYQIDVRNFINGKELDFAANPEPTAEGQWKLQYTIFRNQSPAAKRVAYTASIQSRARVNREQVTTKAGIMYRELGLQGKQYQTMLDQLDQNRGTEVYTPGRLKEIMRSDGWIKKMHSTSTQ
ncbi:mitochondrial protein Pet127-domain-containing protein [Lipomyces tetrasporus]|uniref:Mitochondrial protein Pet127-domain-containing protein n=1 Tax=Lipomyces tetrasporus TaxID=54092 RepID=A0AAD7QL79_9ASCO|nr:mitochondrial protein Pet127-domain-containing protein [Lipomyces tetrasporus]KAJ8097321.1 mitochondrial protein Pet127-domain-containing protein [Lipomyces tetrasporus]